MLYKIVLTTVESTTVEADSKEEAVEMARRFEREANAQHHHGEKTYAEVRTVPVLASCQRLNVYDLQGWVADTE
jgi:hypothetical protein